jgi:hypothetical protein
MTSLKSYRDDDGEFVREGDQISFCYGTPPVGVFADVVDKDGDLVALCPGHNPPECKLKSLRRHVGSFFKRPARKR